MSFLLDTQVLLWAAGDPIRLSKEARGLIEDPASALCFSAASLWKVAIKSGLGCADYRVDARLLRRGLLENDYTELLITGAHAVAVDLLPPIHKDPFDRILIAQAQIEGFTLLTSNKTIGRYAGPIRVL